MAITLATATLLTTGVTACTSTDHQIVLTYWATNQAHTIQTDVHLLTAELKTFTARTGIKVDLEVPTWQTLYGKIETAIASGDGPDVVNIGSTWGPALQATGGFVPLGTAQLAQLGGAGRFVASALASGGERGTSPIAVPLYSQSYALYYNTAMFRAAGIAAAPRTWAEFVSDAKRLTVKGQWGVAVPGGYDTINSHFAFMLGRQNGASLYRQNGSPDLDSRAEIAGVRQWVDLMAVDHVVNPSDAEFAGAEASEAFAQGDAAMLISQTATRGYLASVGMRDFQVAAMPVLSPVPPGGAAVESIVAGTGVGILKSSRHQQAAMKLLQFLTSDAELARLNRAYGTLPPVRALYDQPGFDDPTTRLFGEILADHSEPMPQVPTEGFMETVVGAAVSSLWAKAAVGRVTDGDIAAALADAQRKLVSGS